MLDSTRHARHGDSSVPYVQHLRKHLALWPTFFIVGAPKAGTTSLYRYLQAHPQIFLPERKEPHFFTELRPCQQLRHLYWPVRNERRYLNLFRHAGGAKAIGEGSPSYLITERAAHGIKAKVPKAKIIILVRDPIQRAFSHYLMDVREGVQSLPFYEALVKDYQATEKGWGISRLYVEEGRYYSSVRRYMDLFGTENVLVLVFEELVKAPAQAMLRCLEFLGLESGLLPSDRLRKAYNQFAVPRNWLTGRIIKSRWLRLYVAPLVPTSVRLKLIRTMLLKKGAKPPLDQHAAEYLRPLVTEDLARLETLLGRELPFHTTKRQAGPAASGSPDR